MPRGFTFLLLIALPKGGAFGMANCAHCATPALWPCFVTHLVTALQARLLVSRLPSVHLQNKDESLPGYACR